MPVSACSTTPWMTRHPMEAQGFRNDALQRDVAGTTTQSQRMNPSGGVARCGNRRSSFSPRVMTASPAERGGGNEGMPYGQHAF